MIKLDFTMSYSELGAQAYENARCRWQRTPACRDVIQSMASSPCKDTLVNRCGGLECRAIGTHILEINGKPGKPTFGDNWLLQPNLNICIDCDLAIVFLRMWLI